MKTLVVMEDSVSIVGRWYAPRASGDSTRALGAWSAKFHWDLP